MGNKDQYYLTYIIFGANHKIDIRIHSNGGGKLELIDQLVVSKSHFQKNNQTTIMVLLEIAKEDYLKK